VDRHQSGGEKGRLAIELDAVVGAEVQGALPRGHDHAVRGSDLLDTLQRGDLKLQEHVIGERGAGPVLVEVAWLVERGDVLVAKCHQSLTLDEFSKVPLRNGVAATRWPGEPAGVAT